MVLERVEEEDIVVTTTGMISREAFHARDRPGNFYMIGSMGLASSFGLGLALQSSKRRVIVVDGDGSALMSLGNIPLISYERPENLHYIVLDNGEYETTGGQPCISKEIDLSEIARASGFRFTESIDEMEELASRLQEALARPGPGFFHIRVKSSRVPGIPRVGLDPETLRDRLKAELLRP